MEPVHDIFHAEMYQVQRLVKMLNMILMKKNIKERLIEIQTDEKHVVFVLFEPQLMKPYLNKYQMGGHALSKDDAFSLMK